MKILALAKPKKREDHKFKVSIGYIARAYLE